MILTILIMQLKKANKEKERDFNLEKMIFINTDKKLELIVKTLNLNISIEEHNRLVFELYEHIEHTRSLSFRNGYEQGVYDEKIRVLSE